MIPGKPERPWNVDKLQPKRQLGLRFVVWAVLITGVAAGLFVLAGLFPGRTSSDWNEAQIVQLVLILALVSAGVVFGARLRAREVIRNLAIWAGIALTLLLGYAYQDELRDAGIRLRAELIPSYATISKDDATILMAGEDGHFHVVAQANGIAIPFLIDTGASDIVLTPTDAKRLGIDVSALDFARRYETANGVGRGAPFTLASLSVGSVALADVAVSINETDMRESLLGMSFLKRLASFEVQGRKLILHPR